MTCCPECQAIGGNITPFGGALTVMITREKLLALAQVMGGQVWDCDGPWYAAWGDDNENEFDVQEDGGYDLGTLESLEAKLREWVDADDLNRSIISTYYGKGLHELSLVDAMSQSRDFSGTELECLVDAVLWVADQREKVD